MLNKSIATWKNNPEKVLEQPIELKITKNATTSTTPVVSKSSFSCSSSSSSSSFSFLLPAAHTTDASSAAIAPSNQTSVRTIGSQISNQHGNGSQYLFQTSLCNPTVTPLASEVFGSSYPLQVGQPYTEIFKIFQIQWADAVGYSSENYVNN